jgi:GT2 family glycosyltransferase
VQNLSLIPSVAVVILNYNGREHLKNFLPSVLASVYNNLRVIVADNASTDDSLALVREFFPAVEILEHGYNEGFAGGYNWALKRVDADYYVLLNSDVAVTPGWITPIIELMETDLLISACQPKLLSYYHPTSFEYAGAAGGWIDAFGYPFSRGRIFDVCEVDEGQYEATAPVFWASGASMFVRAKVFHQMGGFDATFFAHQEEIDLCWRMQLAGYRIMACPASVVYHVGAGTLPRGGRKVFLNFRNNLLMIGKNMPFSEKVWKIPVRFALDAVSAWKGLLSGDHQFFLAIFRAHLSVMKRWIRPKAVTQHPLRPLSSLGGVYKNMVIWDYFIRGKNRFSQIVIKKVG